MLLTEELRREITLSGKSLEGKEAFAALWNEEKFSSMPAMIESEMERADPEPLLEELDRGVYNIRFSSMDLSESLERSLNLFKELLAISPLFSWAGGLYASLILSRSLADHFGEADVRRAVRNGSLLLRSLHEYEHKNPFYMMLVTDKEKKEAV